MNFKIILIFFIFINVSSFSRTKKKIPNYEKQISKAISLAKNKKLSQAKNILIDLDKHFPNNSEIYFYLGVYTSWVKDYDRAILLLRKSIKLNPKNNDARIALARVYSWKSELNESIIVLNEVSSDQTSFEHLMLKAKILFWQGEYKNSLDIYQRLILIEPKNDYLLEQISKSYFFQNDYSNALKYATHPDNKTSGLKHDLYLVDIYENSGNISMAKSSLNNLEKKYPKNSDITIKKANLLAKNSELSSAIIELKKNIINDETNIDQLITLGRVYAWNQNQAESEQIYLDVLKIDSDNIEALNGLGRLKIYQGKWGESKKWFQKSIEVKPDNEEARKGLVDLERYLKPNISYDIRNISITDYENKTLKNLNTSKYSSQSVIITKNLDSEFQLSFIYRNENFKFKTYNESLYNYDINTNVFAPGLNFNNQDLTIKSQMSINLSENNSENVYYELENSESNQGGFLYLGYNYEKHLFSINYTLDNLIYIKDQNSNFYYLNTLTFADNYDFNKNLSFLVSYSSRDSQIYEDFGILKFGPRYRIPKMENLLLEYYHSVFFDEDKIRTHELGISYNNIFSNNLRYEINYFLNKWEPYSETFDQLGGILRYNFKNNLFLYGSYTFMREKTKNRGDEVNFRLSYQF